MLWLWHRPAATAPIRLLAWELPYAAGVPLKRQKTKNKKIKKIKQHGKGETSRRNKLDDIGFILSTHLGDFEEDI